MRKGLLAQSDQVYGHGHGRFRSRGSGLCGAPLQSTALRITGR